MDAIQREALKSMMPLDPVRPEEYLEAIRRLIELGFDKWERLESGDGVKPSPDGVWTKTGLFIAICGMAGCALDNLELAHDIDNL